jgi:cytochrome c2
MNRGIVKLEALLPLFGLILTAIVFGSLAVRGFKQLPSEPTLLVPGGDSERGRLLTVRYGCGSCHVIVGIRDATGRVGPRLTDLAEQAYIAGQLTNVPHHLVAWIQDPKRYAPGTAMPDLGVTEAEARDIAAYLYQQ